MWVLRSTVDVQAFCSDLRKTAVYTAFPNYIPKFGYAETSSQAPAALKVILIWNYIRKCLSDRVNRGWKPLPQSIIALCINVVSFSIWLDARGQRRRLYATWALDKTLIRYLKVNTCFQSVWLSYSTLPVPSFQFFPNPKSNYKKLQIWRTNLRLTEQIHNRIRILAGFDLGTTYKQNKDSKKCLFVIVQSTKNINYKLMHEFTCIRPCQIIL